MRKFKGGRDKARDGGKREAFSLPPPLYLEAGEEVQRGSSREKRKR